MEKKLVACGGGWIAMDLQNGSGGWIAMDLKNGSGGWIAMRLFV